jgi:CHAD domain-containing protein
MGVPAAARVAFGGDQHVLAERGQAMTADWTAVRRRLTVRRAAHRPPWGGRQAGHSSIVAPLAATLVASVAVGVGLALAQAERSRRSTKRRHKRERRFAQLPGEPLPQALRRITLGQLDLAIELLSAESDGGRRDGRDLDKETIHETRKALKRLRALVGLLRVELGEPRYKREHAILRDAARRLAGARDAEVMVDTLDALLKRHPRKLGRSRPLIALRGQLVAERAAAAQRTLGDRTTRAQVLRDLGGLRERAQRWELPERPGLTIVEGDLRRVYRQGRRRMRRVERGRGGTHAAHEWRKRVKDMRYGAEILGLRPLARRADELGELLGEEHDLAVLAGLLPPPGRAPFKGRRGKRARRDLLKRIARRRRRLRKRALRDGERLYRRKPKRFARRARRAHARVSR